MMINSSDEDYLPIVVDAPTIKETMKKTGEKKDGGGGGKKVAAKWVPFDQVEVNQRSGTLKKPKKRIA
jgi:hypothetical protein